MKNRQEILHADFSPLLCLLIPEYVNPESKHGALNNIDTIALTVFGELSVSNECNKLQYAAQTKELIQILHCKNIDEMIRSDDLKRNILTCPEVAGDMRLFLIKVGRARRYRYDGGLRMVYLNFKIIPRFIYIHLGGESK